MASSLKCNKSSEFFINAGLFSYEIRPDRYLSANYLFGHQLFGKMIWLSLFWVTEIPILLFPNIKKKLKLNETFVNATSCKCLLKCFNCNIPAFFPCHHIGAECAACYGDPEVMNKKNFFKKLHGPFFFMDGVQLHQG